jgi:hypothetical protein
VDNGMEGKGAGDSTSTEDWEKQPGATPWKPRPWTQTPRRQQLRGLLQNPNLPLRGTISGANPNDVFHLDKVTLALKCKFIQINLHHSKAATAL